MKHDPENPIDLNGDRRPDRIWLNDPDLSWQKPTLWGQVGNESVSAKRLTSLKEFEKKAIFSFLFWETKTSFYDKQGRSFQIGQLVEEAPIEAIRTYVNFRNSSWTRREALINGSWTLLENL
ncbi:MAG: hypothetical protein Q7S68_05745 [Deltaproteobacteria bacterium]|nr:hypothetical protein [Deltaproteobacteria bacterium]